MNHSDEELVPIEDTRERERERAPSATANRRWSITWLALGLFKVHFHASNEAAYRREVYLFDLYY